MCSSFSLALMLAAQSVSLISSAFIVSPALRSQDNALSLIQLSSVQVNSKQKADNWPLPALKGTGQSFYSTNATESAAFIVRYFSKTKMLHDDSRTAEGHKISIVKYCAGGSQFADGCLILKFVETTKHVEDGSIPMKNFVKSAQAVMSRVGAAARDNVTDYSNWIDFHIGMSGQDFKAALAVEDQINMQKYIGGPVLRLPIPSTTGTIELYMFNHTQEEQSSMEALMKYAGVAGPDLCRAESTIKGSGNSYRIRAQDLIWWKSTHAAYDPEAAAEFVVHALGAIRVKTPFLSKSQIQGNDCPTIDWLVLPYNPSSAITEEQALKIAEDNTIEGLMLHFVHNRGWPDSDKSIKTVDEFAEHQEKLRDLDADVFDQYMFNHVELRTDSLDPFVARFQKLNIPYLSRKDPEWYSVYIDIPKNGLVLKIVSSNAPSIALNDRIDETWPVD